MQTWRSGRWMLWALLATSCASGCQSLDPQDGPDNVGGQKHALSLPPMPAGPPPGRLSGGLVAHWGFEQEPGSATAVDAVLLPDHAELRDRDRRSDFGAGRVGGGFHFAGGSWFEVEGSTDLDTIDAELTIAVWLKPFPGRRAVFGRLVPGGDEPYFFLSVEDADRVRFEGPQGTRALVTPRGSLPPHRWSHVAVIWNTQTQTAKIYINGQLKTVSTGFGDGDALSGHPGAFSNLTIGCKKEERPARHRWFDGFQCFHGTMDELLLYNRALDASEVRALAEGFVPHPPLAVPIIGHDEGVAGYDPAAPIVVGPGDSAHYAYAVFTAPVTPLMRSTIEGLGGSFGSMVTRRDGLEMYELTVQGGDPNALAGAIDNAVPAFYNLLPLTTANKLILSDDPVMPGALTKVTVRCGEQVSTATCAAAVEPLLESVLDSHDRFFVGLALEVELMTLAEVAAVRSVEQMSVPHLTLREARVVTGVDAAQAFTRFPVQPETRLSGGGIVIGIYDSGIDPFHPDFFNLETTTLRKESGADFFEPFNLVAGLPGADPFYEDHGTHVAGIAAGNGSHSGSYAQRGIAPAATLFSGKTGHFGPLEHGNVVNHSHINDRDGLYNGTDSDLDDVLHDPWRARDGYFKTIVNAAGNNGLQNDMHGRQKGFYSILNNAKNPIVVGNYDDATGLLAARSSQGPTVDGRIKPDLVAPGTDITSTTFASSEYVPGGGSPAFYTEKSGTSMAAPHVSGVVALLHQIERNRHPDCRGADVCRAYAADAPRNATMRAILIHTAEDLILTEEEAAVAGEPRNPDLGGAPGFYGPGPDFSTGWGLIDAQRAIEVVNGSDYSEHYALRQGETRAYTFRVEDSSPLRVTLAWDDPRASRISLDPSRPATLQELSRLVNDIDMYLVDPSGQPYYPWRLQPFLGTYRAVDGIEDITPQMVRDTVAVRSAVSTVLDAAVNFDHLNNVERVDVDNPATGTWRLVVIGRRIDDVQQFALVHPSNPLELNDSRILYRTRDVEGRLSEWTDDGVTNESPEDNDLHAIQFDTQGWIGRFLGVEARVTSDTGLGESVSSWYRERRDITNYAHLFFSITQVELRVGNPRPSFESRYWGVRYRVREEATGWTPWACSGPVGTSAVPIQALEVELVTSPSPSPCP